MSSLQEIPSSHSSNSGTAEPIRTWANAQCSSRGSPRQLQWVLDQALGALVLGHTMAEHFTFLPRRAKPSRHLLLSFLIKKKKKNKIKKIYIYNKQNENTSLAIQWLCFSGHYPSQTWSGHEQIRSVLNKRKPASDYNTWIVETNTVHNGRKSGEDTVVIIYTWKSYNIQT